MSKISKIIYAISTLAGTIIGVGLFALPYITLQVGIWIMAAYFVVLAAVVILIHLFLGQVALYTEDFLRIPGYAEVHLGKWGKRTALAASIPGFWGVMLAYTVVGGEFLSNLAMPVFGGSTFMYSLIYFAIGAALIYFGIRAISKIEFWGLLLFFLALIVLFFHTYKIFDLNNFSLQLGGTSELFLPYGAILFSLWGASLIPEVEEILKGEKKLLNWVIAGSILISAFIYLVFIFIIVGVTGASTSQEAILGLKNVLGDGAVTTMFCFGLLTTFTSFLALGLTLKKIFWYDLHIRETFSWALACLVPLALFLSGFKDFLKIIGFIGGVTIAISGILIILMYRKVSLTEKGKDIGLKRIYFLIYPLILFLFLGIVYEIAYLF